MYMDLHIIVYGRMKETKNWVSERSPKVARVLILGC